MLGAALARHLPDLRCLGCMPQQAELTLPERHLGLVPASERSDSEAVIERASAIVESAVDIDGLIGLARPSSLGLSLPTVLLPPLGQQIAVARDDAFLFVYPALLEGWRREGAALSFFSPLADEPPEPDADAVYLPGGYPELHAGRLAAAGQFLAGLRHAGAAGKSVYGECGGYMVLGDALTDAVGRTHRMAALLPLTTSFAERRLHLGYRALTLLQDGPLGSAGARFRGHEFHYATTLSASGDGALFAVTDSWGTDFGYAGLRRGSVAGSFIHLIDREDG